MQYHLLFIKLQNLPTKSKKSSDLHAEKEL